MGYRGEVCGFHDPEVERKDQSPAGLSEVGPAAVVWEGGTGQ